jgi:hypothetical protein
MLLFHERGGVFGKWRVEERRVIGQFNNNFAIGKHPENPTPIYGSKFDGMVIHPHSPVFNLQVQTISEPEWQHTLSPDVVEGTRFLTGRFGWFSVSGKRGEAARYRVVVRQRVKNCVAFQDHSYLTCQAPSPHHRFEMLFFQ